VSDEERESFLDNEITPRFPDGLTVLKGYGQFRNASGVTFEERSIVLVLLYPSETRAASSAAGRSYVAFIPGPVQISAV